MTTRQLQTKEAHACNIGLPQAGVQFFVGQFFRIIEVQFSKCKVMLKSSACEKPQTLCLMLRQTNTENWISLKSILKE